MITVAFALALTAAHNDTQSVAKLTLAPDALRLALVVDADRLMEVCLAPPPLGEEWSAAEIAAIADRAGAYVKSHWRLAAGGRAIELAPEGVAPLATRDPATGRESSREVELRFRLPALRDAEVELTETLFELLEPSHRHFVVLIDGATNGDAAATPLQEFAVLGGVPCRFFIADVGPGAGGRRLRMSASAGALAALRAPWLLAFLLALIVAPLPIRVRVASAGCALAAVALAFLAARAGVIAPAAWAARTAAAFACAYVAVENRRGREVRLRRVTALLFGLVHGMALLSEADAARNGAAAAGDALFVAAKLATAALLAALLALTIGRLRRGRLLLDAAAFATGGAGVALALWRQIKP